MTLDEGRGMTLDEGHGMTLDEGHYYICFLLR